MLLKPEKRASLRGHWACMQTLPYKLAQQSKANCHKCILEPLFLQLFDDHNSLLTSQGWLLSFEIN